MKFNTRRNMVKILSASTIYLIGSFTPYSIAWADDTTMETDAGALIREGKLNEAVEGATKQAEKGDADGQYQLGLFYWHGMVVTQNYFESLKWLTLAALAEHKRAKAARLIAIRSVEETTIKKVIDWARSRLLKEANDGDERAFQLLSASYMPEFGFENLSEAYFWSAIAVAVGQNDARRRRDELIKELSASELAKAQDKTAIWYTKWKETRVNQQ